MKKNYITPEIEVTMFESEDVITDSSVYPDGYNQKSGDYGEWQS